MGVYTFPIDFSCTNVFFDSSTICLPVREDCNPGVGDEPGIIVFPGDEWNYNLCQTDKCYFTPYFRGDKIQIQTLFVDPGKEIPTAYNTLIGVRLLDQLNNELETTTGAIASRLMSAWNGKYNFQIIEIDTSLFSHGCWKLELESDGVVVVTNDFKPVPNCKNTLLIKSTYDKKDCFGFSYGEPEEYTGQLIEYDNSLRYWASIKVSGDTIQKERVGSKITSAIVTNSWKLILGEMIPPYTKRIMVNQHLAGQKVFIDGVEYIFDDVVIEEENTKNNMFMFTVRPEKRCNINYNC